MVVLLGSNSNMLAPNCLFPNEAKPSRGYAIWLVRVFGSRRNILRFLLGLNITGNAAAGGDFGLANIVDR